MWRRGRGRLVVVRSFERHLYDSGAAAAAGLDKRATLRVGSGASLVRVWINGYITQEVDRGNGISKALGLLSCSVSSLA